jgi:EAL domain-containing protein (putative c-di-GMP-specific phosphodiesterase class I)/GGDEF domain-containing protein
MRFYAWMARARWLSYRAKIMVMAFAGTHVPLIALAGSYAARGAAGWAEVAWALGVALLATLAGTAATLWVLDRLLQPVMATSRALRRYREGRVLPDLPTGFADEAGTLMADAQRTVTELDTALSRLERLDGATGLLNRAAFLAEGVGAMGVLRLSNFAAIAGSLDRATATGALAELAARAARRLGPDAALARVGDGDLAFRLPEGGAEGLRALVTDLSAPLDLGGVRVTPLLAAGCAGASEAGAEATLDDAVAAAALAAEGRGEGGPVAAHSPAERARLRDRFLMEQELRAALRGGEFQLHFQPVRDVARNAWAGAEALIRWQSPTRGLVSPGQFIPVAEASGLIEPIGLWVLREACREVAGWEPGMRVAVNLSARQFLDEDLGWHVAEAAQAAGISPERLEIELTESVATTDHDHARRVLGGLRDMGVAIAIDDFGTGYASMSALRKLPFDKLKIDREFVTDIHLKPDSQAICTAMVALGQGLGLSVLAEGTETVEEVDWLAGRGCALFQGYYFSRPVPARALRERLSREAPLRAAS